MQELVNVDIEDVYPYEDPEGNSLNPRDFSTPESAEYIAALGEQFRYNKLNPGQPRVKPILLRDGGIYWIIDGECRYRAMKAIGTKRFLAEVYDDVADAETARAEAAKAMVETDCKLNLTAAEMSRGVQTMLSLDIPDDEVAAVARIEPEKVRRARRGARRVADAAYDMTLDRLMAIADLPEEPGARETAPIPTPCTVELRDVTFAYPGGEPVLEHVDFHAAPGEVVALTGPSGEGKTTMIRLMLGLIRPAQGSVSLTGADGQRLPASAATRAAFSYVPQGNTVFAGTIADNLRMVRPEATDAELVSALETACAYDFVSQLPDGIYARTGELGHGLSEGQAQRIAVARAVLRGTQVLLLDEATSALDEATERQMLENLMRSGRVQTCVLITHRAATAGRCDRRYVLHGTRLCEQSAP